jgi:hypothetical protein
MKLPAASAVLACALTSLLALSPITSGQAAKSPEAKDLSSALLLYAPFDGKLDAVRAAGDPKLYTAPEGNRKAAEAGLPKNGLVVHTQGEGKFGDALRFARKMKPVVFFRGDKNLGYDPKGWTGSASLWLRLDPDKDLEPGYCDPLQFVAQAWGEGNMFIEFSKDHTPRHFRYAILPVTKHWNPTGAGWEDIPEPERPMVPVHKPPFGSSEWTHVVFTFGNINSGKKDGWGKLYLNGVVQGEAKGIDAVFNWDVEQSAVTLGLNYVGLLDELAIFNRPLKDAEVKAIYESKGGLGELLK